MSTDEVIDIIRDIIKSDLLRINSKELSLQKFETKSHCLFACTEILHRLMDYYARENMSEHPWDDDPVQVIEDFQTEMCVYARKSQDKFTEQVFLDCEYMACEIIQVIYEY